jgi:hypothetical protein
MVARAPWSGEGKVVAIRSWTGGKRSGEGDGYLYRSNLSLDGANRFMWGITALWFDFYLGGLLI